MKIAKKVLAVVMAVAMIACLSAMAFAAPENAKVALTVSDVVDGKFTAVLSLQNCVDFTAGDIVIGYDNTALEFVPFNAKLDSQQAETLDDAKAFTNAGNTFSGMGNAKEVPGQIKFGFNFVESLDAEAWGVAVDMADVKLFRITFKVLDTTKDTELTVTGTADFVEGEQLVVNDKIAVATKVVEVPSETTTAEETTTEAAETTTQCSPADETTTNKVVGPETGDTGVLAIAAGVVALAGAAFVVSKKRK